MFEDENKYFREKLIILYLLYELGFPISIGDIEEILLSQEILELLVISEVLRELCELNLVVEEYKENIVYYSLSKSAQDVLLPLLPKINDFHKAKLDMAISVFKRKKAKAKFINAEYKKIAEDETVVECVINEDEKRLIKIDLRVYSNEQAEKLCEAWKNRGFDIFQDLMKSFERWLKK